MFSQGSGSVFRPVPSIRLTQFRLRSCTEKRWNWQNLQARRRCWMLIAASVPSDLSPASTQSKVIGVELNRMQCGMQCRMRKQHHQCSSSAMTLQTVLPIWRKARGECRCGMDRREAEVPRNFIDSVALIGQKRVVSSPAVRIHWHAI